MYFGYFGYAVIIFYITGTLILLSDVKAYKNSASKKEQKVSTILGWTNISLGTALMAANWALRVFFW